MLGWWNGRHKGLKIPWGQPREGSSPFPSISCNQRVTSHLTEDYCRVKTRFTQILRNRLAKTSIKSSSIYLSLHSFVELLNFWRGRCVIRGIREKSLPQPQIRHNVAVWQNRSFRHISSYFFLQLREICVILSQNSRENSSALYPISNVSTLYCSRASVSSLV